MLRNTFAIAALVVAACSPTTPPPSTTQSQPEAERVQAAAAPQAPAPQAATAMQGHEGCGEHEKKVHGNDSAWPTLSKFHAVLRPVWHDATPAGDVERVCANADKFIALADAAQKDPIPAALQSKEAAVRSALTRLRTTSETLKKACDDRKSKPIDLQAVMTPLHDAFHGVMQTLHSS